MSTFDVDNSVDNVEKPAAQGLLFHHTSSRSWKGMTPNLSKPDYFTENLSV
ncbi:hypothetical protein [Flavonifractor sp. An92]|uniref:hypothetical protein n=1 Tax=Flavonifractor sp. An92 TaxID=1965666 RepID=UPI0013029AD0|nr:hypothetical protein [Flavonifractor sp. An92]